MCKVSCGKVMDFYQIKFQNDRIRPGLEPFDEPDVFPPIPPLVLPPIPALVFPPIEGGRLLPLPAPKTPELYVPPDLKLPNIPVAGTLLSSLAVFVKIFTKPQKERMTKNPITLHITYSPASPLFLLSGRPGKIPP